VVEMAKARGQRINRLKLWGQVAALVWQITCGVVKLIWMGWRPGRGPRRSTQTPKDKK
jgi:hypothetical protein